MGFIRFRKVRGGLILFMFYLGMRESAARNGSHWDSFVRGKQGKELQNDALNPTLVHSPVCRIFANRSNSRGPRSGLSGLTSNSEKGPGSTDDNQVGESHCPGRTRTARTASKPLNTDFSD